MPSIKQGHVEQNSNVMVVDVPERRLAVIKTAVALIIISHAPLLVGRHLQPIDKSFAETIMIA